MQSSWQRRRGPAAGVTAAEGLGEVVGVGEVGLGVVATPAVVKGVAATSAKGASAATLADALAEELRTAARMAFAAVEAKEVAGGYAEAMMMFAMIGVSTADDAARLALVRDA